MTIGIRKPSAPRKADVLIQFLLESRGLDEHGAVSAESVRLDHLANQPPPSSLPCRQRPVMVAVLGHRSIGSRRLFFRHRPANKARAPRPR